MVPKVNIVIRTLNEESWIKYCLIHCLNQSYDNFTITIVDSGSNDGTLEIIREISKKYPSLIVLKSVEVFKPGNAINIGAITCDSDYFICISAHCIPENKTWISSYIEFMENNSDVMGAFGRQLPLSCTHADDARDLLITFGAEERIIERDYFFHNANSIIRTSFWKDHPFDNDTPHIEDRIWAKRVVELGFKTAYLPQAGVYHYHGLHQHGQAKSFRAVNVLNVMHSLEGIDEAQKVTSLLAENIDIPVVIIIPPGHEAKKHIYDKLNAIISEYRDGTDVFVISNFMNLAEDFDCRFIDRSDVDTDEGVSVRVLMRNTLLKIEDYLSRIVDGLIFYDLDFHHINPVLGKKCSEVLFNEWVPAVLPAWKDHGNYWIQKRMDMKISKIRLVYVKKNQHCFAQYWAKVGQLELMFFVQMRFIYLLER